MAWEADVRIAGPVGSMGQRAAADRQPAGGAGAAALETRVASATAGPNLDGPDVAVAAADRRARLRVEQLDRAGPDRDLDRSC